MVIWAIWLFVLVASFAVLEGWALKSNRMTLSRFVWTVTKAWPPLPFIAGFVAGFLACHFFWGGIVSFAPASILDRPAIQETVGHE